MAQNNENAKQKERQLLLTRYRATGLLFSTFCRREGLSQDASWDLYTRTDLCLCNEHYKYSIYKLIRVLTEQKGHPLEDVRHLKGLYSLALTLRLYYVNPPSCDSCPEASLEVRTRKLAIYNAVQCASKPPEWLVDHKTVEWFWRKIYWYRWHEGKRLKEIRSNSWDYWDGWCKEQGISDPFGRDGDIGRFYEIMSALACVPFELLDSSEECNGIYSLVYDIANIVQNAEVDMRQHGLAENPYLRECRFQMACELLKEFFSMPATGTVVD